MSASRLRPYAQLSAAAHRSASGNPPERPPIPAEVIRLTDGRRVEVRPIRRSDADGLLELYARLSPESRRSRFFTSGTTKRLADAVRLTAFAGRYDCVLVAIETAERGGPIGAPGAPGAIAAVAQLADFATGVEAALVVRDDYQGAGLGGELFRQLLLVASRQGISRVEASVLSGNSRILRILRNHSAQLAPAGSGVLQATIPCATPAVRNDGVDPARRV